MTTQSRIERLTRGMSNRGAAILAGGSQLHTDVEHIAGILEALEDAGAIRYPDDLPEDERGADVVRQLEALRYGYATID